MTKDLKNVGASVRARLLRLAGERREDFQLLGPLREDQRYGGVRVMLTAKIATARIRLQVDVGFGEAMRCGSRRTPTSRGTDRSTSDSDFRV